MLALEASVVAMQARLDNLEDRVRQTESWVQWLGRLFQAIFRVPRDVGTPHAQVSRSLLC
jgi:hypothetical protein